MGKLSAADRVRRSVSPSPTPIVFLDPSGPSTGILTATLPSAFLWDPGRPGIWGGEQPRPGLCSPLDGNVDPWVPAPDPEREQILATAPNSKTANTEEASLGPPKRRREAPSPGPARGAALGSAQSSMVGKLRAPGFHTAPGEERVGGKASASSVCVCLLGSASRS